MKPKVKLPPVNSRGYYIEQAARRIIEMLHLSHRYAQDNYAHCKAHALSNVTPGGIPEDFVSDDIRSRLVDRLYYHYSKELHRAYKASLQPSANEKVERNKELMLLHGEGMSVAALANHFGIGENSVRVILDRQEYYARRRSRPEPVLEK